MIKSICYLVSIVICILFSCKEDQKLTQIQEGDNNKSVSESSYTWKPLKIGGGGWVVGMYIHPNEPNLIYIRTDVSGAYRWDSGSSQWKQIVTSSSLPSTYVEYAAYKGVQSLVGAPEDPDIAYMAFQGQIFRSSDKGNNWLSTSFGDNNVAMEPNGPGRQEGERLSVDPHNSNIVYFGSINNGLWTTQNGGTNWSKVESIPVGMAKHGVNTVIFDKNSGISDSKTNTIYVTVDNAGVFKSSNGGLDWINISDDGPGSNRRFRDAEIGSDGTYYVASTIENGSVGSVWKYTSLGNWEDISPSGSQRYEDIAVDPNNERLLMVIKAGGATWTSYDKGVTWTSQGFERRSTSIDWLGEQTDTWLSVGEVQFDPSEEGKLWFAEGFGVWWTNDLSGNRITWQEVSKGIEETCGNDVICPSGGKPVTAMWDLGSFYHQNIDSYDAQRSRSTFISCWDLDWCPADPNFIVGVFHDHTEYHSPVDDTGYSTDGGQTWTAFPAVANGTAPSGLKYGTIAVSAENTNNIVWLPANDELPYCTVDKGVSWQLASFEESATSGFNQYSTSSKPLCADRVQASTFYFYHKSNGIYCSTDGGITWKKTGGNPASNRWGATLKATPGCAGDLWFSEGKQSSIVGGLWHSTDGGQNWTAIKGIEQAFNFGFGKTGNHSGYPAIFMAGVIGGQHGIYRSADSGNTWLKIGEYPLGIFDYIDGMDGDKNVFGRVYVCLSGGGFAYGEPI